MAGLIGALIITGASEGVDKYRSRRAMKRRATLPPESSMNDDSPAYSEASSTSPFAASSSSGPASASITNNRSRTGEQKARHRRGLQDYLAELPDEDGHDAPPPYNPPTYYERPAPTHTDSLPASSSSDFYRYPDAAGASSSRSRAGPRELGGIQRADGRKACRVGADGRCECGKLVSGPSREREQSPEAPEKESYDERMERKKKEGYSLKSGRFWNTMGLSFLRGFVI